MNTPRRTALAVLLFAGLTPAASARSLDWTLVSGYGLESSLAAQAKLGFEVQAVVLEAPDPAVLLARPCCGRRAPVASYRVVDRARAANVEALGDEGRRLVAFGSARSGGAIAVLAGSAAGAPAAAGEAVRYRSLVGEATSLGAEIERLAGEGFRCAAAAGRTLSAPDWVVLARDGRTAPREARVVTAPNAAALGEALAPLARDGYALECAWGRSSGRFSLGGSTHLAAIVGRSKGAARPVAHTRITLGSTPEGRGTLLAVAPYGSRLAFFHREDRGDVSHREVAWAGPGTEETWNARSGLEERMRSFFWDPVDVAWAVWDAGKPSRLVAVERDDDARRELLAAEARAATAPVAAAEPPAIPSGATALSADGGEPWAAWQALAGAIRRQDLKSARALWTGEVAKRWDERVKMFKAPFGMGFSEKELFEGLADDLPADPAVVGGWLQGDAARVRVEGTIDGERSVADLDFSREGGRWKLAAESSWKALGAP